MESLLCVSGARIQRSGPQNQFSQETCTFWRWGSLTCSPTEGGQGGSGGTEDRQCGREASAGRPGQALRVEASPGAQRRPCTAGEATSGGCSLEYGLGAGGEMLVVRWERILWA